MDLAKGTQHEMDASHETAGAGSRQRIGAKQALFHAAFVTGVARDAAPVVRRFRHLAAAAFDWYAGEAHARRVRRLARLYPAFARGRAVALAWSRGAEAASEGCGRLAQVASMSRLIGHGVRPTDWHRLALHRVDPALRGHVVNYFEGAIVQKFIHRAAPMAEVDDKTRLAATARAAGLRVPPILATVSPETEVDALAAALVPGDLFAKRTDFGWGIGALRFVHESGEGAQAAWIAGDGARLDRRAVAQRLVEASRTGPMLVQPRLRNGGSVAALTPGGLATLRIVTIRARPKAEPELLGAVLRMPVAKDAITDNFASGGVAAPILDARGTLGSGATKRSFTARLSTHPATGAPIEGAVVGEFPDALALARAAHARFPWLHSVGWDIAITDDGPTLIEGNIAWCPELMQQVSGKPLLAGIYGDACSSIETA